MAEWRRVRAGCVTLTHTGTRLRTNDTVVRLHHLPLTSDSQRRLCIRHDHLRLHRWTCQPSNEQR